MFRLVVISVSPVISFRVYFQNFAHFVLAYLISCFFIQINELFFMNLFIHLIIVTILGRFFQALCNFVGNVLLCFI